VEEQEGQFTARRKGPQEVLRVKSGGGGALFLLPGLRGGGGEVADGEQLFLFASRRATKLSYSKIIILSFLVNPFELTGTYLHLV